MSDAIFTPEDIAFLAELDKLKRFNKLDFYEAYPKQLDFIEMGRDRNERLFFAGNRVGKSDCGAYELAVHLTGRYPPNWPGRVYHRPVVAWAAGASAEVSRDVQQEKLLGKPGQTAALGTGFIPRDCIVGKPTRATHSVANAIDTVQVRHFTNGVEDGVSSLSFKSYEQGREKFQGSDVVIIWFDEEPSKQDVYTEGIARGSAIPDSMAFMTFTPLLGRSSVVNRFLSEPSRLRGWVRMGMAEAGHITPEMIEAAREKYPKHEWAARIDGFPLLGEGAIFTYEKDQLEFSPTLDVPLHWRKIWGIDFGLTHPFAAVFCLYDPDTDTIYVYRTYKAANQLPISHVDGILRIAGGFPVAWPHDGAKRESNMEQIATQYRKLGLRMLPSHATFLDGSISTEAAVFEMYQRMGDGRFRVASNLVDWWDEYSMYHRKDGQIVKVHDDLLSATQKVVMAKRFALPGAIGASINRRLLHTPRRAISTEFDVLTGRAFPS